jgi:hypothetical protein
LSSTTERSRGQALALFAIALSALMMAAALAFDVGAVLLERRDQQNAADAAAVAAARYVGTDVSRARSAAFEAAAANGFIHGVDSQSVVVNYPPTKGPFQGKSRYIEVEIGSTRPSLFASIAGIASFPVGARAVSTNGDLTDGLFSILALDPTALCLHARVRVRQPLVYGHQVNLKKRGGAAGRAAGPSTWTSMAVMQRRAISGTAAPRRLRLHPERGAPEVLTRSRGCRRPSRLCPRRWCAWQAPTSQWLPRLPQ